MRRWLLRLDAKAGALNAWLLVAAIGLGALDATVLVALRGPAIVASLVGHAEASREPAGRSWPSGDMPASPAAALGAP
jgi:hypothetical protein